MASIPISDILRLSVAERLKIVGEIWESIASEPEALPLTETQRKEILRRSEAHKAKPQEAIPLEEAFDRREEVEALSTMRGMELSDEKVMSGAWRSRKPRGHSRGH